MKLRTSNALIIDIHSIDVKHRDEIMKLIGRFGQVSRTQILDNQLVVSLNQDASYKTKQEIIDTITRLASTEYKIDAEDDLIEGQILYQHEAHKKAKQYSEQYPNEYVRVIEQPFREPDRIQSIYFAGIEYKAATK